MLGAYYVGREGQTKAGLSLSPQHLWWQHTAGAAQALAGDLGWVAVPWATCCRAARPILWCSTPKPRLCLARKTGAGRTTWMSCCSAMIVLGDDRLVERTVISQALDAPTR